MINKIPNILAVFYNLIKNIVNFSEILIADASSFKKTEMKKSTLILQTALILIFISVLAPIPIQAYQFEGQEYDWPFHDANGQPSINIGPISGTLGEFRGSSTTPRLHSGLDIAMKGKFYSIREGEQINTSDFGNGNVRKFWTYDTNGSRIAAYVHVQNVLQEVERKVNEIKRKQYKDYSSVNKPFYRFLSINDIVPVIDEANTIVGWKVPRSFSMGEVQNSQGHLHLVIVDPNNASRWVNPLIIFPIADNKNGVIKDIALRDINSDRNIILSSTDPNIVGFNSVELIFRGYDITEIYGGKENFAKIRAILDDGQIIKEWDFSKLSGGSDINNGRMLDGSNAGDVYSTKSPYESKCCKPVDFYYRLGEFNITPGKHKIRIEAFDYNLGNLRTSIIGERNFSVPRFVTSGFHPSISPDGNTIAFNRFVSPTGCSYGLYLISSDGSGERILRSSSTLSYATPSFSDNGQNIVFIRKTVPSSGICWVYQSDLGLMDFSGGNEQILYSSSNRGITSPDISSDGSFFVFSSYNSSGEWISKLVSGIEIRLADSDLFGFPRISPDDTTIAYRSPDGNLAFIGGSVIANTIGDGHSWSPDGSKIVYDAYDVGTSQHNLYVFNITSKTSTLLIESAYNTEPSWSANANVIAFERADGIWVVEI